MSAALVTALSFSLNPQQDGQPLHITPGDAGGATNEGITLETFREAEGDESLTAADLGRITADQINAIYAVKFWNPINGDSLPLPIAVMTMDHAVNCGPTAAGRCLQRACGLTAPSDVDGWIGKETIDLVAKLDAHALMFKLRTEQEAYYRACKGFAEFGHGWLLRLGRRMTFSMNLFGGAPAAVPPPPAPKAPPAAHAAVAARAPAPVHPAVVPVHPTPRVVHSVTGAPPQPTADQLDALENPTLVLGS
jgi:lysozyme family protein